MSQHKYDIIDGAMLLLALTLPLLLLGLAVLLIQLESVRVFDLLVMP